MTKRNQAIIIILVGIAAVSVAANQAYDLQRKYRVDKCTERAWGNVEDAKKLSKNALQTIEDLCMIDPSVGAK